MKTKIVCTIGPSVDSYEGIKKLVATGMNIARVNCSHLDAEKARKVITHLQDVRSKEKLDFMIMLDTKGPDIRIGLFENGSVDLIEGQTFTFTTKQIEGNKERVYVNYPRLPEVVKKGQDILLVDGMIRMVVTSTTDTDVLCKVELGGTLGGRKSMFVPGCELGLPFLSEPDKADLKVAAETKCDLIAASFVGSRKNLTDMKAWLKECGQEVPIISKIESVEAIGNLDEILDETDGVMVARGDLGVEYPIWELPALQKMIVEKCRERGIFCIMATEMLESMIERPRPTRAEATDIANAVWLGASAVMLSAETAVGKYPFLAVDYMKKIASYAESQG